ncbi:MAG TPA: glycosyltransferase [Longimicrobiales bacterium]|nr:glycosyltransferase [Longimicrobiales bacterium]
MLTVVSVAFPLAPVGPDAVGGAEQVLWQLDAALTAAGHRSVVVACEGSRVAGTLVSFPAPTGPLDDAARAAARAGCRQALDRALRRWSADLVHMHGLDFDAYLPDPGVPVLATLHLPPEWYAPRVFRLERPDTWLQCVSASQHERCPPAARLLPPIENGVPLDRFGARVSRRGFALALGRICPEKGFHHALDAATRAGVPLLLGGVVFGYEAHERYFREAIVPRLDARHRFIGPVSARRKRRLLAAARCVVIPSLVPETSSLVAIEALASGTPVVAHPAGALAGIVDHGRTGFLVHDEAEMADAIAAAPGIDPAACRAAARERHSAERMSAEYLELYRRVAGSGGVPAALRAE